MKQTMQRTAKILVGVLFVIILVACTRSPTGKVVQQEPITLAWIGPLTGSSASLGIDNYHGVELAVKELNKNGGINGHGIHLVVEDDQMDPKLTVNAYQKVTTIDYADAILSPSYSGLLSIVDKADRSKTVIVNSLDTSEEIAAGGEYLFGVGIYDEGIGQTLAEFTYATLQQQNVAIIYNNEDAFMSLVKDAFTVRFEELGGKIATAKAYTAETNDFRTMLLQIDSENINTLVVLGYDEAGFILRQAQEMGLNFTILGTDTFTSKNFLRNAEGAEGAYFTSWHSESEAYQQFLQRFTKQYGKAPEQPLFSAAGYDAVMVVAEAMRHGGTSGKALHDALYRVRELDGITGTLTMSPDGIVRSVREEMFQIHDGEPASVE